jgi:hypothetical protein
MCNWSAASSDCNLQGSGLNNNSIDVIGHVMSRSRTTASTVMVTARMQAKGGVQQGGVATIIAKQPTAMKMTGKMA